VQGLRRFYAVRLLRSGHAQIVRVRDAETVVLAEIAYPTELEKKVSISLSVSGSSITAIVDGLTLKASDDSDHALLDGGIGLLVAEGALSTDEVRVSAVD